jgi:hypothetical protein
MADPVLGVSDKFPSVVVYVPDAAEVCGSIWTAHAQPSDEEVHVTVADSAAEGPCGRASNASQEKPPLVRQALGILMDEPPDAARLDVYVPSDWNVMSPVTLKPEASISSVGHPASMEALGTQTWATIHRPARFPPQALSEPHSSLPLPLPRPLPLAVPPQFRSNAPAPTATTASALFHVAVGRPSHSIEVHRSAIRQRSAGDVLSRTTRATPRASLPLPPPGPQREAATKCRGASDSVRARRLSFGLPTRPDRAKASSSLSLNNPTGEIANKPDPP